MAEITAYFLTKQSNKRLCFGGNPIKIKKRGYYGKEINDPNCRPGNGSNH
jgi:hypothetical protein